MADIVEKVTEIVPTFYYDVIARIVPGAATIIGVAYVTGKPVWITSAVDVFVLLGAGYVVGILLSPLSTALLFPLRYREKLKRFSDEDIWVGVNWRSADSDAAVVTKMAAESTCAENMVVGAIIVLALAFLSLQGFA